MGVISIPFVFPEVPSVRCAFQVRSGQEPYAGNIAFTVGDDPDAVFANRRALAASLGLKHLAESEQVHGDTLLWEPQPIPLHTDTGLPPAMPQGDGLATTTPHLGLLIKTADCQPILIAHEQGQHIAALHVGWRGNRMGFIQSAIRRFCERYQLAPEALFAVRGASLGTGKAEFIHYATEWGDAYKQWYDPITRTMNLWELTRAQLLEAGLRSERLFNLDLCTASLPELFFSYRRDTICGRQASLIWIDAAQ